MRIGIDASRAFVDQPTGTERYAYEMITNILALPEARRHEWVLYTKFSIFNDQFLINLLKTKNLKLKIKAIRLPYLWTQVGLAARTWMDNLDVLWVPAHTLPLLRQPGWLRKGKPLKTLVTIHGIEYEWLPAYENKLQRWYLPLSTKYAVATADKIIAVSGFTKQQLVSRLGADPGKIKVVYEGVTENYQLPILKEFYLKPKQYLIFVGTVQPRKNLVRLIEAFAITKNIKLVIAGKLGWNYDEIVAAPKKYGVEDRVVITGYISEGDRYSLMRSALAYVQPSVTEGFGLPILEAWQAGLPVVSSRGGALAEIVGKAGLLFDPLDIRDMSHKLSLVINSHALQKDLINMGQERLKMFSWKRAAQDILKVIEDLE